MTCAAMLLRALVIGYLRTNRLRAAVTLLAVALGVAAAYAIDLANATAIASFASSVDVIADRVNLQLVGSGVGFDERALLRVASLAGVVNASPVVEGDVTIDTARGAQGGELLRVLGVDVTRAGLPPGAFAAQHANVGFDLARFINARGVFISARVAKERKVSVGGTLRVTADARPVALQVMGIIPPRTVGVDSSVAFVDVATAQELFASIGRLDRIDLEVDPSRVAAVRHAVEHVAPSGSRVVTPKTRRAEVARMLASFQMNLTALSLIALVVGMYLIYNTVAISVAQRTSDVGTLRALGTTRRAIFATFVGEGALYGVLGSLLGLALGLALARFSVRAVETTVATLYVSAHADRVDVTWWPTLKSFALGTMLAMVSAAFPAIEAAATAPARALRASAASERQVPGFSRATGAIGLGLLIGGWIALQAPALGGIPVFGYAGGVLLIAGASFCTPLLLRSAVYGLRTPWTRGGAVTIALAFLRASPRRFSVAIASLAVAIAMMVAIAILVGSFRATLVAWTQDALAADLYVGSTDASASRGAFTPRLVARVARIAGVQAVDTLRTFDVPLAGRFATLGAIDVDALVTRGRLRFIGRVDRTNLASVMRETDTAVVSEPFSTQFALRSGDAFTLVTPSGLRRFRIAAVYNDYSTGGGTFFISHQTYVRRYHDESVDSLAVYLSANAKVPKVRSAIAHALVPLRAQINTNAELRNYALALFERTFAITSAIYLVSLVIAVLGVVSTLFALVLERRLDVALLRYVGLSRAGVHATVLVQAIVVGVLAGVLGLALGTALGYDLIFVINRQSFGWLIEWHAPIHLYVQSFAIVVIAALVSALYPARVAARIRTAQVLRVE